MTVLRFNTYTASWRTAPSPQSIILSGTSVRPSAGYSSVPEAVSFTAVQLYGMTSELLGQSSKLTSPLLESGFPYLAGCYMGSLVGGLNTL